MSPRVSYVLFSGKIDSLLQQSCIPETRSLTGFPQGIVGNQSFFHRGLSSTKLRLRCSSCLLLSSSFAGCLFLFPLSVEQSWKRETTCCTAPFSSINLLWRSQNLPLMTWSTAMSRLTMMKSPEPTFQLSPFHPFLLLPIQRKWFFAVVWLENKGVCEYIKTIRISPLDGWTNGWMDEWMTFEADIKESLCKLSIRLPTLSASSDSSPTNSAKAESFHEKIWNNVKAYYHY